MRASAIALATAMLMGSQHALALAEGMTDASVKTVKPAVENTFEALNIQMAEIAVMFVHGTAGGRSRETGSNVIVSFTQIPNEGTKVVVTTDKPEDAELEQAVLDAILAEVTDDE